MTPSEFHPTASVFYCGIPYLKQIYANNAFSDASNTKMTSESNSRGTGLLEQRRDNRGPRFVGPKTSNVEPAPQKSEVE